MKRIPGDNDPGKRKKPDGARPGKGSSSRKPAFGGKRGNKDAGHSGDTASADAKTFRSRKPYEKKHEEPDAPRFSKDRKDNRPSRPWKRDEESGAPREKRSFDRPSGEHPDKSRRPFEKRPYSANAPRFSKDNNEGKPFRPRKRDEESGAPREKRYSDHPSGDVPDKDRKPYKIKREDTDAPRPYKKRLEKGSGEPFSSRERNSESSETSGGDSTWKRGDHEYKPERRTGSRDTGTKRPSFKKRESDYASPKPGGFCRDKFSSQDKPARGKRGYGEDGTIRLNKYLANAGICSRREADTLIESGAVSVNGKVVTLLGTRISREDQVQFGGETLSMEKKVYLLLNKPKGYITTVDDPQDRNTVMMLVKDACRERIYPVGRLDRNTTGLLLFTNDGDVAKKLTHPGHKVRKVYHVELNKGLSKADMLQLSEGIELEDGLMAVDEIAYTGNADDKKNIGVVIHSGKNRVVRRLFEALDYEVVKLDRVAFANLTKKDLPRGRWRFLEQQEINMLMMI